MHLLFIFNTFTKNAASGGSDNTLEQYDKHYPMAQIISADDGGNERRFSPRVRVTLEGWSGGGGCERCRAAE